ncbi:glycosyltransferase [Brevibacillus centrosporus]|uniref:TPR domain-containing glycosyltransferase n=1 Tax=Brevibacillus centrosporus TaxID=54910 RepID=UPI003D227CB1
MRISACVITKNEENALPKCLSSVREIVDEIIVVDTGSTDRTVEIAKSSGADVYSFTWINDFSAAKNEAVSKAKGDWIVFLDADEYLASDKVSKVRPAIEEAHRKGFDFIKGLITNINTETQEMYNSSPHVRIFRNDPCIRFSGAIHEKVVHSSGVVRVYDATRDVSIIHTGYSPEIIREKEKSKRNLELLFKELEKTPDNSDIHFYISESYLINREYENALEYAQKVIEHNNATLYGLYQKNLVNILHCRIELNHQQEEIIKSIQKAINSYPEFPDFYFFLGDAFRKAHRSHDAITAFETGLGMVNQNLAAQSSAHFHAAKVYAIVGQLYEKVGQLPLCVERFVQSLKINPYYFNALAHLIRIFSKHENVKNTVLFMDKIYNTSRSKDLVLLIRATLESGNVLLAEHYISTLSSSTREALGVLHTEYVYLREQYKEAAVSFKDIYLHTKEQKIAVQGIVASWLSNQQELIEEYIGMVTPSLQNLIRTLQGEQTAPIDKEEFLMTVHELIRLKKWEHLLMIAERIDEEQLLLEAAELFYQLEQYGFAFEFYDMFLQKGIDRNIEAVVLIKMANCLKSNGEWESALQLLSESAERNPIEYAVYEVMLDIFTTTQDNEGITRTLNVAKRLFPESNYLCSFEQKYLH